MRAAELRQKDVGVLHEEFRSLEQTRLDISIRAVTEPGEGHKLLAIRKDIARYKTVLNEKRRVDGK